MWNYLFHDALKKRICRYLLQHYLGTFLARKISLDQLTIDITKGKGTICDIELDVESLNEVFRNQNIPVEMVSGTVGEISVSIPWSALVSESSTVEVKGLRITLAPRCRVDAMVSSDLLDSMFSSMVTSMQVAETCVQETQGVDASASGAASSADEGDGLQRIASTIDTVLAQIRVSLTDTEVALSCNCPELERTASLRLSIEQAEYSDTSSSSGSYGNEQPAAGHSNLTLSKHLRLMGVHLTMDDWPLSGPNNSYSSSPVGNASYEQQPEQLQEQQQHPIKIAQLFGKTELRLEFKLEEKLSGPKFKCDINNGITHCLLSPGQLQLLMSIVNAFTASQQQRQQQQQQQQLQQQRRWQMEQGSLNDIYSRSLGASPGSGLSRPIASGELHRRRDAILLN